MRMKESIRSLRGYFYFVAIASALIYGLLLMTNMANVGVLVVSLVGLALSAAFLYVAIAFRTLIYENPGQIKGVIFASIGFNIIGFLLSLMGGQTNPIGLAVGLAIDFYLLANVQRISTKGEE